MSLRLRLTLVYGGLFLVAGFLLLAVNLLLFRERFSIGLVPPPGEHRELRQVIVNGDAVLTGEAARLWLGEQRDALVAAATKTLLVQGSLALLVVGAAALLFGWLVAGRMLRPLRSVTATAGRIAAAPVTERGLRKRIGLRGPDDEVKELADTFDGMVERLEHAFDGQRRFVANASHELRTPLTLNRALVELAMHRRTASADVVRLGEDLLRINTRHEKLIDGLLLLARSEQELPSPSPVDLADVAAHVVEQCAAEASAADIKVTVAASPAPTSGDGLLLEQLVRNLVENGIRHNTGPGGWVRVETGLSGFGVAVTVSNSGPAIPAYDVPVLFEPFRRLDGDRVTSAKGSGLGMSIVRSVARAHGGSAQAEPRADGGLTVSVRLPASSPEPGPDSSPYR
ncbi:HAMP domain-containing sensor histidine kinase [Actinoplanes sp. NPDC051861]|uniref:sensor histidine kinase n=1 Tax=Actinoplanes sp. NPDC051861 TaxID=3155170 RepID=UPI00343274DB